MEYTQQKSRLLQLPAELQLAIFEFAIIENKPLLVNCPCDSSFPSADDDQQHKEEKALWESGEKQPPFQPGLTRTCTAVRCITLPMFYQQNIFRAHYCYATDFGMAMKWLKLIGPTNRLLLRDFCLWDWNWLFDVQSPKDLKLVKRGDIVRGMGGELKTLKRNGHCCHKITFGEEHHDYYELIPGLFDD